MKDQEAHAPIRCHIAEAVVGAGAIAGLVAIAFMLTGMAAPKMGEGLIRIANNPGAQYSN